jgi:hypothetical protein
MIVSGREWPVSSQRDVNNDAQGEAVRQLRLRQRNMCLLARSFLAEGFTVVLDDIIVSSRFDELRDDLHDLAFAFIMLCPDTETVRARERQRGTNLWPEWEWLTESILTTSLRPGLWLDTSAQAPDETVDEILRRAGEAVLPPATVQEARR